MRMKALHGGPFGAGRYALASVHDVDSGFDRVRFAVLEPRAGVVLAIADAKVEALAGARRLLAAGAALGLDDQRPRQAEMFPDEPAQLNEVAKAARAVPRRRREVFERSAGNCFYCSSPITLLDFEVEHQLPKALGGGDDGINLVASCRRCNRLKGPRSSIEFVAAASRDSA